MGLNRSIVEGDARAHARVPIPAILTDLIPEGEANKICTNKKKVCVPQDVKYRF